MRERPVSQGVWTRCGHPGQAPRPCSGPIRMPSLITVGFDSTARLCCTFQNTEAIKVVYTPGLVTQLQPVPRGSGHWRPENSSPGFGPGSRKEDPLGSPGDPKLCCFCLLTPSTPGSVARGGLSAHETVCPPEGLVTGSQASAPPPHLRIFTGAAWSRQLAPHQKPEPVLRSQQTSPNQSPSTSFTPQPGSLVPAPVHGRRLPLQGGSRLGESLTRSSAWSWDGQPPRPIRKRPCPGASDELSAFSKEHATLKLLPQRQ